MNEFRAYITQARITCFTTPKTNNSNFTLLLSWYFRLPPVQGKISRNDLAYDNCNTSSFPALLPKVLDKLAENGLPALKTLHCPSSFTLRFGVGFLLPFLIDATVVRMCPHDPTWTPLRLFHHLCLFHQNRELSDP